MATSPPIRPTVALRWPLSALLAWAAGWAAMLGLARAAGLPPPLAVAAGLVVAAAPALLAAGLGGALPGWAWLLPLAALALGARLRCPWARVERGDMWRGSWAGHDLVYLFQRPESMARALAKADAEMQRGSWVVSLEFEAAGRPPHARMTLPSGRPVWVYRIGG